MNIRQHITITDLPIGVYADKVGVSRMTLNRILRGVPPGQITAKKFVDFSSGQITYDEIYKSQVEDSVT